ncbi:MAG: hydrogenase nickel incorporation protein HypB [Anaerolineae bacterium]|nr:hydrogenase nickel incorporation protein HypB [Anaerolineae bacterium]
MTAKRVPVVERILSANDRLAEENQRLLNAKGILAVNLMASPGAGKTSLIRRTVEALQGRLRLGAIEGDLAGTLDADLLSDMGVPAVQINTGGGCHLEAQMVQEALARLPLDDLDLIIIENVGNLVCPAGFLLGAQRSVVIASVPEGDDKPYKYPGIYRGIHALVLNKTDLLPYVEFDVARFRRGIEVLNPGVAFFPLSCKTGEGLEAWVAWLEGALEEVRGRRAET